MSVAHTRTGTALLPLLCEEWDMTCGVVIVDQGKGEVGEISHLEYECTELIIPCLRKSAACLALAWLMCLSCDSSSLRGWVPVPPLAL